MYMSHVTKLLESMEVHGTDMDSAKMHFTISQCSATNPMSQVVGGCAPSSCIGQDPVTTEYFVINGWLLVAK